MSRRALMLQLTQSVSSLDRRNQPTKIATVGSSMLSQINPISRTNQQLFIAIPKVRTQVIPSYPKNESQKIPDINPRCLAVAQNPKNPWLCRQLRQVPSQVPSMPSCNSPTTPVRAPRTAVVMKTSRISGWFDLVQRWGGWGGRKLDIKKTYQYM